MIEHAVKGDTIFALNVTARHKAGIASLYSGIAVLNLTFAEIMIPPEFSVGRVLFRRGLAISCQERSSTVQKTS